MISTFMEGILMRSTISNKRSKNKLKREREREREPETDAKQELKVLKERENTDNHDNEGFHKRITIVNFFSKLNDIPGVSIT
jgi:hypothetical protein